MSGVGSTEPPSRRRLDGAGQGAEAAASPPLEREPSGSAGFAGAGAGVSRIRVLLVEDNDVYRESLEFLLDRFDDIDVVGAVAEGSVTADACAELGADVAVVDIRLPDMHGAEVAEAVRERSPGTAIVFLSASAGAAEIEAVGSRVPFVRKDEGVDALVRAVQSAAGRT